MVRVSAEADARDRGKDAPLGPLTGNAARRVRLAFICAGDPEDVLTWSGTPLHMLHALQREFEVTTVIRRPWGFWSHLLRRAIRRLSGGAIDVYWWPKWTKLAAGRAITEITNSNCDVVFAVAITPICAELVKHRPTIFVSDATQASMVNYNPRHIALAPALKKTAAALESTCIQNAVFSLFPSDWASRSAIGDHGGARDRIVQVPWGANMLADEIVPPETRSADEWRLLFVGSNWQGKGGDIALDAVAEMRRRGHKVHLDVAGSSPPEPMQVEGVTFHGFLDKRNPADDARIKALFKTADVFFLPTRFDALGIVFAEAASYAVPSVSYRTGGVPSMVVDGATGVLLEEGAPAEAFAEALIKLLADRQKYVEMSYAAQAASRTRLNWDAWGTRVREEIEARLAAQAADKMSASC
jgi:glycosyltransferase involved in cell wall biosynthesis